MCQPVAPTYYSDRGERPRGTDRSPERLQEKENTMLRVVFPTIAGFAALMTVWGGVALTYMM